MTPRQSFALFSLVLVASALLPETGYSKSLYFACGEDTPQSAETALKDLTNLRQGESTDSTLAAKIDYDENAGFHKDQIKTNDFHIAYGSDVWQTLEPLQVEGDTFFINRSQAWYQSQASRIKFSAGNCDGSETSFGQAFYFRSSILPPLHEESADDWVQLECRCWMAD